MIDREQISIMVKDIEKYLHDLEELGIKSKKDIEDKKTYYASSMLVFSIMNRVVDIANEIISGSENMRLPDTYRDVFEILLKNKVISGETASAMTGLMKYRNVIAHEYYELSADRIYRIKKDISKVEEFISEIRKYLQRKQ